MYPNISVEYVLNFNPAPPPPPPIDCNFLMNDVLELKYIPEGCARHVQ